MRSKRKEYKKRSVHNVHKHSEYALIEQLQRRGTLAQQVIEQCAEADVTGCRYIHTHCRTKQPLLKMWNPT